MPRWIILIHNNCNQVSHCYFYSLIKDIIYLYLTYSNFLRQWSGFSGLITIWQSSSQWRIGSLSCSSQSISSTVSTARRVSERSALQLDSPWLRLSSYWLTALLCDWLSSCSIASTTSCPLYHCKPHTFYTLYQLDSYRDSNSVHTDSQPFSMRLTQLL